jgi:hypothetical protein
VGYTPHKLSHLEYDEACGFERDRGPASTHPEFNMRWRGREEIAGQNKLVGEQFLATGHFMFAEQESEEFLDKRVKIIFVRSTGGAYIFNASRATSLNVEEIASAESLKREWLDLFDPAWVNAQHRMPSPKTVRGVFRDTPNELLPASVKSVLFIKERPA